MIPTTKTLFAIEEIFWAESTLYKDFAENISTTGHRGIILGDMIDTSSTDMVVDPVSPKRIQLRKDTLPDDRTMYNF
ncbi:hypothetical protein PanWU01x14_361980 [Parasponia andersonii]|uniref:Uncharacterized protein n=1 Tax=Parasponia andersonii TaxID=3476 RepID=A0A2P5A738_PARAD|nr:hypothetical protein PanWU01x14_361980 [Parasponia andersonii]